MSSLMVLFFVILGTSSFLFILCKHITFCFGGFSRCSLSLRTALQYGVQARLQQ